MSTTEPHISRQRAEHFALPEGGGRGCEHIGREDTAYLLGVSMEHVRWLDFEGHLRFEDVRIGPHTKRLVPRRDVEALAERPYYGREPE